jgi:hypothetical protein
LVGNKLENSCLHNYEGNRLNVHEVLTELEKLGSPEVKQIKAGFAITAENSHGIFLKDIKALAKRIGKNDALALERFDTGIYEARLLCSKLYNPRNMTEALMEKWSATFENWEICDTFCWADRVTASINCGRNCCTIPSSGRLATTSSHQCIVTSQYIKVMC